MDFKTIATSIALLIIAFIIIWALYWKIRRFSFHKLSPAQKRFLLSKLGTPSNTCSLPPELIRAIEAAGGRVEGHTPIKPISDPEMLRKRLAVLEQCGLKVAQPFTYTDLLESCATSHCEESSWDMPLIALGTLNENRFEYQCANLWHFDTECIEDHGDYGEIVERMADMAQGSLAIRNIKDYVNTDKGKAWVSFTLRGEKIKWTFSVQDDWVDWSIFTRFASLLEKTDPAKTFICYDMGGQDYIIGCVYKDQLRMLNAHGIKFEALN